MEQGRETYVQPGDFFLFWLYFLCAAGTMTLQMCQMETVTLKLLEDTALTPTTAWLT